MLFEELFALKNPATELLSRMNVPVSTKVGTGEVEDCDQFFVNGDGGW